MTRQRRCHYRPVLLFSLFRNKTEYALDESENIRIVGIMTTKQIEKLRTETAKFGMDFEPEFFSREEDVKQVIRWSKGDDKPSRSDVRKNLEKLGCHSVEHLQTTNINLDWI